jgi:hypothetical protein
LTFGLSFFWTAKTVVVPRVVWRAILQMMIDDDFNHHQIIIKVTNLSQLFYQRSCSSYPYKLIFGI